jgi:hypothetical protein
VFSNWTGIDAISAIENVIGRQGNGVLTGNGNDTRLGGLGDDSPYTIRMDAPGQCSIQRSHFGSLRLGVPKSAWVIGKKQIILSSAFGPSHAFRTALPSCSKTILI